MMDHHKNHCRTDKILFAIMTWALFAFFLSGGNTLFAGEPSVKFPTSPVRIYIPAGAGGSLGQEIRTVAPFLEKRLGVSTPIEYITGADGLIAYNKIYQEKPNGQTIISFNLSSAVSLELTRDTAKYEVKKLTPVAVWNSKIHALVTHPDKWKTFADFLSDARKSPVSIAVVGGSSAFQGNLMEAGLGIKINWVPYTASGEAMAAVAGKHADAVLTFSISPKPMIRAGKLKALAVFSSTPDPVLPEVPHFKQLGYPEVPLVVVYGVMMAPPNTPGEVARILENAVKEATANPEFNKQAENVGMTVDFKSSQELQKLIAGEYDVLNKYKQFLK
jgi:tripartite-type tricarboxylate transporter receptor subunit TctC